MTLEFQLARITAHSKSTELEFIEGWMPEMTPEDIRLAVSCIREPMAFHALMAKYCADSTSEWMLMELLRDFSLLAFTERWPRRSISGEDHNKLIECAMVYYLNPSQGQRRSDKGNAAHMGIHPETWRNKYKQHFKAITAALFNLEYVAIRDIRRVMKRD